MITVLYSLVYSTDINNRRNVSPKVQYLTIENCCNVGLVVSDLNEIDRLPHDKGDGCESVAEHIRQSDFKGVHFRYIHV